MNLDNYFYRNNMTNTVKLPRGRTVQDMLDDIARLAQDNIGLDVELADCFFVYSLKDGSTSYIGQTIKSANIMQMIGALEEIKYHLLSNGEF